MNARRFDVLDDKWGDSTTEFKLVVHGAATAIAWLVVASLDNLAAPAAIAITGSILAAALIAAFQQQFAIALRRIAYLCALQPAIRLYATNLPYLSLEYVIPAIALFTTIHPKSKKWSAATIFLAMFVLIDFADVSRAESWQFARAVVFPSLALFSMLVIGERAGLTKTEVESALSSYVAGLMGIVALVGRMYATGRVQEWAASSNFDAAGGMGPNQVSILFSVGTFVLFVWAERSSVRTALALRIVAGVMALLMILTFSRGGLYLFVGALCVYLAFTNRRKIETVGTAALACALIVGALQLSNNLTAGVAVERYAERTTSDRARIFLEAWQIFRDHPSVGVGSGGLFTEIAASRRLGLVAGAHNEFARAAAEHGIFGVFTWAGFFLAAIAGAARRHNLRGLRLALTLLAMCILFYNGLKLVLVPLLLCSSISLGKSGAQLVRAGDRRVPVRGESILRRPPLGSVGSA